MNVLNRDQPEAVDDLTRKLVGEVPTPVSDTRMNLAHGLLSMTTLFGSFGLCTQLALDFAKVFLIGTGRCAPSRTTVELGGRYSLIGGQVGEVFQPNINANLLLRDWQGFRVFHLTREGGPPLASGVALEGAGLGSAFKRSVKQDSNLSDLGDRQGSATVRGAPSRRTFEFAPVSHLGTGERVVAIPPLEPGIAWFLSRFHPSIEGLHGKVKTHSDVLQDAQRRSEGLGCERP